MTIHGLSKVLHGGSRIERVVWFAFILFGFTLAILTTVKLWQNYFDDRLNVVYTKYKDVERMYIPTITMCDQKKRQILDSSVQIDPRHENPSILLYKDIKECSHNTSGIGCLNDALFGIGSLTASKDYSNIENANHLLSLEPGIESVCVTFNKNGSLYTTTSDKMVRIVILQNPKYPKRKWTQIYVNNPGEQYYKASTNVLQASREVYSIGMEKTEVERLGEPYSNCKSDDDNNEKDKLETNIFGGVYSSVKCVESCRLREIVESCGDVPFQYRHFIPNKWYSSSHNNKNISALEKCIKDHKSKRYCKLSCPHSCQQNKIKLSIVKGSAIHSNALFLLFSFPTMTVEHIEEFRLYSWQELLSNFGGVLGLMTGFSLMSVFEIIIYLILLVNEKFIKHKLVNG